MIETASYPNSRAICDNLRFLSILEQLTESDKREELIGKANAAIEERPVTSVREAVATVRQIDNDYIKHNPRYKYQGATFNAIDKLFEQIEQVADAEADSEARPNADQYYYIIDHVNFNRSNTMKEPHVINKCLDFCKKQMDAT